MVKWKIEQKRAKLERRREIVGNALRLTARLTLFYLRHEDYIDHWSGQKEGNDSRGSKDLDSDFVPLAHLSYADPILVVEHFPEFLAIRPFLRKETIEKLSGDVKVSRPSSDLRPVLRTLREDIHRIEREWSLV